MTIYFSLREMDSEAGIIGVVQANIDKNGNLVNDGLPDRVRNALQQHFDADIKDEVVTKIQNRCMRAYRNYPSDVVATINGVTRSIEIAQTWLY